MGRGFRVQGSSIVLLGCAADLVLALAGSVGGVCWQGFTGGHASEAPSNPGAPALVVQITCWERSGRVATPSSWPDLLCLAKTERKRAQPLGPPPAWRLCRIRNRDMTPCEGVTIQDMGHKIGCNGVDNGQLVFNHYVVPRCVYGLGFLGLRVEAI